MNTTGDGTTSGPKKNSTPVANTWFHKLRMNHENKDGFYTEVAFPLNNDNGIHYRVIAAGNEIFTWRQLVDTTYLSSLNYTTMSGVESNGNLVRRHPSYSNIMYLGWSGSSIICRVDSTDFTLCRASLSGTTLTITI